MLNKKVALITGIEGCIFNIYSKIFIYYGI